MCWQIPHRRFQYQSSRSSMTTATIHQPTLVDCTCENRTYTYIYPFFDPTKFAPPFMEMFLIAMPHMSSMSHSRSCSSAPFLHLGALSHRGSWDGHFPSGRLADGQKVSNLKKWTSATWGYNRSFPIGSMVLPYML